MVVTSFDTLPIELVYKILDYIDVQTLFFSFRYVCRRFYIIGNSYNRCELDLSTISKIDFHRICRIICPENIISLTLSDREMTPNQIHLFTSFFNMNQFIHLRSLTLIQIEKIQLNQLMNHVQLHSLNKLSINIRNENSLSKDESIIILLRNITTANIQKLDLSMWSHEIHDFVWPTQCTLKHLSLGHCVQFKQVYTIISQSTSLQTLVLQNGNIDNSNEIVNISSDIQKNINLICLKFENSHLQMNKLELLLLLTPCLIHLQLTGSVNSSDPILNGSQWEEFIQTNLIFLEKFEFFIRTKIDNYHNINDIESWIVPFRSMFWIKYKSWFVTCNYIMKTAILRLYTMPICTSSVTYESDTDKIVYTTCSRIDNDTFTMVNVREIQLDLIPLMIAVTTQKIPLRADYLFHKLSYLTLDIKGEWSSDSIDYLSSLIDLSQLTSLELYLSISNCSTSNTIKNMNRLLRQTYRIHTLTFANLPFGINLNDIIEDLCSIIPEHIKHLDIYDINVDGIKILLTRLRHLSSVTFLFFFDMPFNLIEIIEWLSSRIDFTYLIDNSSFSIWLGNRITT